MTFHLGIKSDPIEYRYSYDWLFSFMQRKQIRFLQLGTFFELYHLADDWFYELSDGAARYDVRIKSCFTAHRELGGFFSGNVHMARVGRRCYERLIEVASLLGADFAGSNPGAVLRDMPETKHDGIARYLNHLDELSHIAATRGLNGITMEPMSSLFEPPSTPEEIEMMVTFLARDLGRVANRVPLYLCGDVSHGLVGADGSVLYGHETVFEHSIPWMAEFHFKNTDSAYHGTFGFGAGDGKRGIVDLTRIRDIVFDNADLWPVDQVVGYLEIGGPKLGRDDTDPHLESMLDESIEAIRAVFGEC